MGTFTTKLKLDGPAFVVRGDLDFYVQRVTVGQIRVTETAPKARWSEEGPCYKEEYMCYETGVGSGNLWEYGRSIFATEEEAKLGVIAHQQRAYKERAIRDAYQAEQAERRRKLDLLTLQSLKEKYESAASA
jgi:hypothetical protein